MEEIEIAGTLSPAETMTILIGGKFRGESNVGWLWLTEESEALGEGDFAQWKNDVLDAASATTVVIGGHITESLWEYDSCGSIEDWVEQNHRSADDLEFWFCDSDLSDEVLREAFDELCAAGY